MSILVHPQSELIREPRLLVPGMQPLGAVRVADTQFFELSTALHIKRLEVWSTGVIRGNALTVVGSPTRVGTPNGLAHMGAASPAAYSYAAINETDHTGLFLFAQFVATTNEIIVHMGGTSATLGCYLVLGTDASNVLTAYYRRTSPDGTAITVAGPTLVPGRVYTACAYVRTVPARKVGIMCDGVDYLFSAGDTTGSDSQLGWYTVSGSKRTSGASGSGAKVLLSGYGRIPESDMSSRKFLLEFSRDPYQFLIPA